MPSPGRNGKRVQTDNQTKKRLKTAEGLLLFWTLFIGLGAVAGASGMLLDPSGKAMGMDGMLPYFQKLPFADVLFRNLFFSGIALLCVNGIPNLIAATLLILRRKAGVFLGGLFGFTLMLWICIQFYMFPLNFMSTIYFIFGLCQLLTAYAAYGFARQTEFSVRREDYPNIGTDKEKLVVFFSRRGYCKKLAYREADRTGAEVTEIMTGEKISGMFGFLWCGRFGMHRRGMPIAPICADFSHYAHVTLVTPIWVFAISSPMREFLRRAEGQIHHYDLVVCHFSNFRYLAAKREAEALLHAPAASFRSVRCRFGQFKESQRKQKLP